MQAFCWACIHRLHPCTDDAHSHGLRTVAWVAYCFVGCTHTYMSQHTRACLHCTLLFRRGTLAGVLAEFRARDTIKGEMVLVVERATEAVAAVAEAGAQAALAAAGQLSQTGDAGQTRQQIGETGDTGQTSHSNGQTSLTSETITGGSSSSSGASDANGSSVHPEASSGSSTSSSSSSATAAAAAAGVAAAAATAAAAGDSTALRRMIAEALSSGVSVSAAARQLSQQLGVGRSQLYKMALQVEAEGMQQGKQKDRP